MLLVSESNSTNTINEGVSTVYNFAAATFASGNQMGTTNKIVGPNHGVTQIIKEVHIFDWDDQKIPIDLRLFRENPGNGANNSALSFSEFSLIYEIARISILASDYSSQNNLASAHISGLDIPINFNKGTEIYAVFEAKGAGTFTAADHLKYAIGMIDYE